MPEDDVPQPARDPAAERRARARQQMIYRRRRTVAVLAAAAALFVIVGLFTLLLTGSHKPSRVVAATTPRPTTAGIAKTSAPTLRERETQAIEQTLTRMPLVGVAGRKVRDIALTFDDGPGPYTLGVTKVLKRMNVPATFFQVGQAVPVFPDAERAQLNNPAFEMADHTESHPHLTSLSPSDQATQIDDAASRVINAGGKAPRLFRPPFGAFNHTTLGLLASRHLLMILWTIDSQDYERPGVPVIVNNVVSKAKPGAIVLMHDAGGDRTQTIAALPKIIKALRAKHYHLVSVPRLLLDDPPPLKQPAIGVGVG